MQSNNERRNNIFFLIICFEIVFLIYGHTLAGNFVFDDRSIVSHKNLLQNIANYPKIVTMGYWSKEAGLYRPVILLSYALNYSLFGDSAFSFHLINLIFYALVGYLIFLLFHRLFPKRKLLPYLTSILFLVLPIHTEAVANIVGRAEIFALFFSLLMFLELLKKKINPWKAGLWLFLAIGSKEIAIAALPIAFIIIFIKNKLLLDKTFTKKYFPPLLTMFLSTASYLTARFFALGLYFLKTNASLVENPLKFAAFWPRIATALKILILYLGKIFWPIGLCSDYSYNQIPVLANFFNWQAIFGLLIIFLLIVGPIILIKKRPILALGLSWFLLAFLPISNLIFPIGTIMGERLMFFASVGICLCLSDFLIFLIKRSNKKLIKLLTSGLICALICFYAIVSFIRNIDWLTEKRLFISAGKCAPNSILSQSNLATVYYFEGNYDKAEKILLSAQKRIYDKYSKAINNLGLIYWKKGEYDKAEKEYFKAIKNWPPYEGVYENLVLLYLSQGKKKEAERWARIAFPEIYKNINY